MKKTIYYLMLLVACPFTFNACSSDDDDPEEKFVWNGDWNDPADPNYVAAGYNPVEGYWRGTYNTTAGLYFAPQRVQYFIRKYDGNTVITK